MFAENEAMWQPRWPFELVSSWISKFIAKHADQVSGKQQAAAIVEHPMARTASASLNTAGALHTVNALLFSGRNSGIYTWNV